MYSAETIARNDQYTTEGTCYSQQELHRQIYSSPSDHPGKVHYVIVCRVVMGCYLRTGKRLPDHHLEDMDRSETGVWAPGSGSTRVLKMIPGDYTGAKINFHALVAEKGDFIMRHREFLQFHKARVCPAFLLAYRRVLK